MCPGRELNPKKQFKVCRFNRLNYRGCCSSFRAVISRFQIAQNRSSATSLAESEGFEPPKRFIACTLSSGVVSANSPNFPVKTCLSSQTDKEKNTKHTIQLLIHYYY